MSLLRRAIKSVVDNVAPELMDRRYERLIKAAAVAEKEIALLPALCRPGSVAIDVGANQGLYVHYLLPLVERVVAFEPLPAMQAKLARFYGDRISLQAIALSSEAGLAQLRMPAGNPSWATMAQSNHLELAEPGKAIVVVDVEMRTLDSYAFRDVSFIKIDVEGNEEAVLQGAVETVQRERPNLVIEVEERHSPGSVHRVARRLEGLGYEGFYLLDGELKPFHTFDLTRDQNVSNVGLLGKVGRYINNFIYVPQDKVTEVTSRVPQLLG